MCTGTRPWGSCPQGHDTRNLLHHRRDPGQTRRVLNESEPPPSPPPSPPPQPPPPPAVSLTGCTILGDFLWNAS